MDGEAPAGATYTFTVDGPRDLLANFAINTYMISATANDDDFGSVTGGGEYDHFATATLTASPNTGYHFVNWTTAKHPPELPIPLQWMARVICLQISPSIHI